MKNLYFFILFLTLGLLSCNNTPTETKEEKTEAPAVSENANWETFWKNFQTAVGKNDMGGIVQLTNLPLQGNFFTSNQEGGLSRAGFIKNYAKIFDATVVDRLGKVKESEWKDVEFSNQKEADDKGVPLNAKAKLLQLNYVFDEGTDSQTESAQLFYFAKINGEYRLCSMFIVG